MVTDVVFSHVVSMYFVEMTGTAIFVL